MLSAVTLFASGGIGDLALRAAGVKAIVANELLDERVELFKRNFPETEMIAGDIWDIKERLISRTKSLLGGRELDFLLATPPCQGMSKNGRGKLLNMVRNHGKAEFDKRNELIIPTVSIIKALRPRVVVMENVPEMENTLIPRDGDVDDLVNILDYVSESLADEYIGSWQVVEFANYGVPQRRQRLITVFTRDDRLINTFSTRQSFLPPVTHSEGGRLGLEPWVTVRETIGHLPPLDAAEKSTAVHEKLSWHEVPLLDKSKYFWVSNTPAERGAFDNQCTNLKCGYKGNATHGSYRTEDGVNRAKEDTPLYCEQCGEILPRPWVGSGNERRLMKGFTSAYKRMSWNSPCSTLTTNFAYACSDNKLHPDQNRTLSTLEALMLHTISDFEYLFEKTNGAAVKKQILRDIIGESVPPRGLKVIFDYLVATLLDNQTHHINPTLSKEVGQLPLSI